MKLSKAAIKKVNELTVRLSLALELKVTERWIAQCIKENTENGPLTKTAAIQVIQEKTGLSFDQILETGKAKVKFLS